jgi:hypothetical protein
MQREALAARAQQAIGRHWELQAELHALCAHAKAKWEVTERLRLQITALNEASRSRRRNPDGAIWQMIEASERYGTLKERTAILLLASAFMSANEKLIEIAQAA